MLVDIKETQTLKTNFYKHAKIMDEGIKDFKLKKEESLHFSYCCYSNNQYIYCHHRPIHNAL